MLVLHRLKSNSQTSKFFNEKKKGLIVVALLYLILKLNATKCNQNRLNCGCDIVAVLQRHKKPRLFKRTFFQNLSLVFNVELFMFMAHLYHTIIVLRIKDIITVGKTIGR